MPTQQTHLPLVRKWCQSLGVLSAVSISRDEAEMKLAAYVPLLMQRFPEAAFTAASLDYVAGLARKGFPTYGELVGWLGDHWRDNRPPLRQALPPPPSERPRDPPTPELIEHSARVVAEMTAALRSKDRPVEQSRWSGPNYLSPEQLAAARREASLRG
jgi:hypothetical protein